MNIISYLSLSPGKIRMAAGNMIRNLQRRSKKWRRSFDEHTAVAEQDRTSDVHRSERTQSDKELFSKNIEIDTKSTPSDSLNTEGNDARGTVPPECDDSQDSPLFNGCLKRCRTRPMSSVLPAGCKSIGSNVNELRSKVFSHNNLSRQQSRDQSADIWVPRQRHPSLRRTTSDVNSSVGSSSRHSSVASSEASQPFGSGKSLLRISQESLADSGVSETPNSSPNNTLPRTNLSRDRKEHISRSLSNIGSPLDAQNKLSRLDRRSWGEWISAEMELTPSGEIESEAHEWEVENDNKQPKNKRKLTKVVKQLFSGKKK